MFGAWHRKGDFYNDSTSEEKNCRFFLSAAHTDIDCGRRVVSFIASLDSAVIPTINIRWRNNVHDVQHGGNHYYSQYIDFTINFTFSPLYQQALIDACDALGIAYDIIEETFPQLVAGRVDRATVDLHATFYEVNLDFSEYNLSKIIQLLEYFNQKIQPKPFSPELIAELINICLSGNNNCFSNQHFISDSAYREFKKYCYQYRFSGEETLAQLLEYFTDDTKPGDYKSYKYHLKHLANPNQPAVPADHSFGTPLVYAMLAQATEDALELLIHYHANPFTRPFADKNTPMRSLSAMELGVAFGQYVRVNTIVAAFTRIEKTPLTLNQPEVAYKNKAVSSTFKFSNQSIIRTAFKVVADMDEELEKRPIYSLFTKPFEALGDINNKHLSQLFERDFSENKLIDIIYDGNNIIGFNLFEMVVTDKHKPFIFLHWVYAAISPGYSGNGLMLFLAFRLPLMLQLIFPRSQVGAFCSMISYNSFRMINQSNLIYFPKYQTEALRLIVTDLIDAIYPSDTSYFIDNDSMTAYINEALRVREDRSNNRELSVHEKVFKRDCIGLNGSATNDGTRGIPVLYFVGRESYDHTKKAADNLGIQNFSAHLYAYAKCLQLFLNDLYSHIDMTYLNMSLLSRSSIGIFTVNSLKQLHAYTESRTKTKSML